MSDESEDYSGADYNSEGRFSSNGSDMSIDLGNGNPWDNIDTSPLQNMETYEERKENQLTPELLNNFSQKDTSKLVEYFNQIPSTRTQDGAYVPYALEKLSNKGLEYLANEIKGKKIIELGDAGRRRNEKLLIDLGAESIDYADPLSSGVDGFSYLARQPDESAIVCSFGLFDIGVLYHSFCEPEELVKYQKLLTDEIYRVTPKNGVTFHGLEFDYTLKESGFNADSNAPDELNTKTDQRGGLVLLRKWNL